MSSNTTIDMESIKAAANGEPGAAEAFTFDLADIECLCKMIIQRHTAMRDYIRGMQDGMREYPEMFGGPEAREFQIKTAFELLACVEDVSLDRAYHKFLAERYGNAVGPICAREDEGFVAALDDLCEHYWSHFEEENRQSDEEDGV